MLAHAPRRGSATAESVVLTCLLAAVAGVGWASPAAFHDAVFAQSADAPAVVVSGMVDGWSVPPLLARPGAEAGPLAGSVVDAPAPCEAGTTGDPWVASGCGQEEATGDGLPWAATPWGVE